MNFCTHRLTQPVSRWISAFVVKSSTQDSKQCDTRLENIYKNKMLVLCCQLMWKGMKKMSMNSRIWVAVGTDAKAKTKYDAQPDVSVCDRPVDSAGEWKKLLVVKPG